MAKTLNEHLLNDSHNFISLAGVEFAIQRHLQVIFQELSKLSLFHFASAHDNFQNHETMKFSRVLIEIKFFFSRFRSSFFYSTSRYLSSNWSRIIYCFSKMDMFWKKFFQLSSQELKIIFLLFNYLCKII